METHGFYITVFKYFECSNLIGPANIPADGTKTLHILPDVFFFPYACTPQGKIWMACVTTVDGTSSHRRLPTNASETADAGSCAGVGYSLSAGGLVLLLVIYSLTP